MTKTVAEMTVEEGLEFAVRTFLVHGWDGTYYNDWKAVVVDEGQDEDFEDSEYYSFLEEGGVWTAFEEYTDRDTHLAGGITVKFEGDHNSGVAVGNSAYFVILSLEDSTGKRFFKRDGYYSSYEGGNLADGTSHEVYPQAKLVTVWKDER